MPSDLAGRMSEKYAFSLVRVMGDLESEIISFMRGVGATTEQAAATVLNSRGNFIKALRDSGYNDLAQEYIAQYGVVPEAVKKAFAKRKLPAPKFSTISVETFTGLARIDLEMFQAIGSKAMEDLRIGLYKQTIAGQSFKDIVKTIKASTTGVGKNNSPLYNYSYTHANTAILNFNGEVIKAAGESIGFDKDSSKWQVVGPLDSKTREECRNALETPVRTRKQWLDAGYFGGSPGGYN